MPSERRFNAWPQRWPHRLTTPAGGLYFNLEVSATRFPDKAAIHYYAKTLSYRELKRQVDALAGHLAPAVEKGERVILFMQNCPQFVIAFYALMRLGAIAAPINPMNVTAELSAKVADAGAAVAIVAHELYAQVEPLVLSGALSQVIVTAYSEYAAADNETRTPELVRAPSTAPSHPRVTAWSAALEAGAAGASRREIGSDDISLVLYTSGTTGEAKGCVHTHGSVMFNAVGSALWSNLRADATVLASVPLFHVTGLQHCMNNAIFAGATMVIMTRWDAELALDLIGGYRVTHWTNIPTMVVDVLSHPRALAADWSSLGFIGGGGSAMPEAIAKALFELTGLAYQEGYGSTESISQTHWNPPGRAKRQCLGIAVWETDARVIDPDSLRELGPNEVGEVVSSGPQIMQGYWNKPEATRAAFIELEGKRFLRTGDLGRYDEEGYFFIVDRLKRMINAAGFKVWPAEVEMKLYEHPSIQEACVIAAPDARRGETVKAVVVLKAGAHRQTTAEEIIDWARGQMSAYKVPRQVQFVDSLPKSASGKIQWRLLQETEFKPLGSPN